MEVSGGQVPASGVAKPPKAHPFWRALAVVLALALGIAAAAVIATMIDISDKGVCGAIKSDCYDFPSGAKPFVLAFGWASGVVGALTAIAALVFTFRGRGGRQVLMGLGLTLALTAVWVLIAQLS